MEVPGRTRSERVKAAAGAVVLEGLLLYALAAGLGVTMPAAVSDRLRLIDLLREPPPPASRVIPPRARTARREAAASPPNLRSQASEVVVPPARPLPVPPPVVAAPIAGLGSDPSAGAANVAGPGTGSGGQGNGNGSGRGGNGDGGGWATGPRLLRGRLKDSDYPRAAGEAGIGGSVSVRIAVGADGRVARCVVTGSSGNPDLDETTCRLIAQRYRYRPARNADGRAVPSIAAESHDWIVRERQAEPDP
jgi:protein TonB